MSDGVRFGREPHSALEYFRWVGVPQHRRLIAMMFFDLAYNLDQSVPNGVPKEHGLARLADAREWFLRAADDQHALTELGESREQLPPDVAARSGRPDPSWRVGPR